MTSVSMAPSSEVPTSPAPGVGEERAAFSLRWLLLPLVVFSVAAAVVYDLSGVLFHQSRKAHALKLVRPGMDVGQAERVLNSEGYLIRVYSTPSLRVYTTRHYSFLVRGAYHLRFKLPRNFAANILKDGLYPFYDWYEDNCSFLMTRNPAGDLQEERPKPFVWRATGDSMTVAVEIATC